LRQHAQERPNKAAIVFEGKTLSWTELWQKVEAATAGLGQYLPNDTQQVVALLMPNSPDFVVAYLAIVHSGHIAFPLDPAYKSLEIDAIIEQVPSELIITDSKYRDRIGEHHEPIVLVEQLLDPKRRPPNLLRFSANEQIASVTFTSGTTGRPKAVPNTHANHVWNIEVCSKVWRWTSDDSLLISLPLSHWYGIVMGLTGALYHGNTLYLQAWFDEQETLKELSSGKVSFFTHISQAYLKLLEVERGKYDLSKVRLCVSGGAPLPPEVWRQFKSRHGIEIVETYGSSETGRITANTLDKKMLGSAGKILPGVDMKLGKLGEVQIKSPGVFPGYFHNARATRAAHTANGYFRTGDIGELRDGWLFLKGRKQEQIRRFGYTISPRDVEWALHQNPQIKDIYVMARQRTGQPNDELIYFVVSDLSDSQIRDYCKQNLLFAWRPDRIIHLESLPRTRSGKPRLVQFRQLVGQEA
jgi:acyl-CoA synthetase (AMP-forming)/AMP-acid ligase II